MTFLLARNTGWFRGPMTAQFLLAKVLLFCESKLYVCFRLKGTFQDHLFKLNGYQSNYKHKDSTQVNSPDFKVLKGQASKQASLMRNTEVKVS